MNTGPIHQPSLPPLLALRTEEGETPIRVSRQWPEKRRDILRRVGGLMGEFPQQAPPLELEMEPAEDLGDFQRQKVRYQVEPGEFCPAWLLQPKPLSVRQPAVLCCHQTAARGKDEPAGVAGESSLALAVELVRRGFVCLAPDCITAGERVYPGAEPYETAPFYERNPGRSAAGKMLWDHQRALDVLSHLDVVHPDRLGVIGHSLGGHNAIFLAVFDHRIKVTAASCAYMPFSADPNPKRWCRDQWFVYFPLLKEYIDRGRHPPFTWLEMLALIAPRAVHYTFAMHDDCFPDGEAVAADMVQLGRLYDLLGVRQKFGYYADEDGHRYDAPAREAAYGWIERVLMVEDRA